MLNKTSHDCHDRPAIVSWTEYRLEEAEFSRVPVELDQEQKYEITRTVRELSLQGEVRKASQLLRNLVENAARSGWARLAGCMHDSAACALIGSSGARRNVSWLRH